ncbi:MAG: pilus assembly protein PilM [Gammaproteobacteria bacterium]|nr:pilus assembly protein PilM [Gammaproteobacteria bacterium]
MSVVARTLSALRAQSAAVQIGPIGVDLALECVHLVQLESVAGGSTQVRARASIPFEAPRRELLTSPHQFRSLLRRALDSDRFYGRKAVLAMPAGMFRTVSVNYQFAGAKEKEADAVLQVMKDRLDGDLSQYVLDYMPVTNQSKSGERLAIVAVSDRQPVIDFLELARKAKLDVHALEIGPVAISRLVGAMSTAQGASNALVINSGRSASYLTLISGSNLLFDQEIGLGEDNLIKQVAETLDISVNMARDMVLRTGVHPGAEGEATMSEEDNGLMMTMSEILKPQFLKLVEEVKRAFLYAAAETRGGAVSKVYLLGGIARWRGADRLLSNLADVDVQTIPDPLALFPAENGRDAEAPRSSASEVAVATGLALRGMDCG